MTTPEWLSERVGTLIASERAYSKDLAENDRESRLRLLREIELTARLRHLIGGLDTLMSARGADISSKDPLIDIQVKFPGYWHLKLDKPQPVDVKEIEKDMRWLVEDGGAPRHIVLFLPQRLLGFGVQKAGGANSPGRRRFQHTFSATAAILATVPLCAKLVEAISETVTHTKRDGEPSLFRQYRDVNTYDQVVDGTLRISTVGDPVSDLVWALVLSPTAAGP